MPLSADRDQIRRHLTALFHNADPGSFISLRGFEDIPNGKSWHFAGWRMLPVDNIDDVIDAADDYATAAANVTVPVVVCPPNCTFNNGTTATEKDVVNGLVLTAEIDSDAAAKRARLEALLGVTATIALASGGEWIDPQTGVVEDKQHIHFRLAAPTRTPQEHAQLKEARDLTARLIGSDTSAVPLVHPLRLAGSWHKKATPRLCHILEYNPENEVVLADALDRLRRATGAAPGPGATSAQRTPQAPPLDILAALACIPNDDVEWNAWNTTGLQIFAAYGGSTAGLAAFHAWSAQSRKYNADNTNERWQHWLGGHGPSRTDVRALFNRARAANPNFVRPSRQQATVPSQPQPAPPPKQWPTIGSAAYHGLAGRVVALFIPHTEADPAAILVHFLVEVGNVIGRHAYYLVEATRHHPSLFALIVGRTAKARKGTAADRSKQMLAIIDPGWAQANYRGGLSTGEGLIWAVRDPIEELVWHGKGVNRHQVVEIIDKGVEDKRLLVVESEFARTISVMERPGTTLSSILRQAWDNGNLEVMARSSKARATDAHISVIGHITEAELVERLTSTDKANGFANRFLTVLAKRSQLLPFGGKLGPADLAPLAKEIAEAVELAETLGRVELSLPARPRWREIYEELAQEKPGLTGSILARGEPQVIRLALIYALLDKHSVIDVAHLDAAYELWRYCEASTEYIFGDATGDAMADEILRALRQAAPGWLSQMDIRSLFSHHHSAARLNAALDVLLRHQKVRQDKRQIGLGPATTVWFAL